MPRPTSPLYPERKKRHQRASPRNLGWTVVAAASITSACSGDTPGRSDQAQQSTSTIAGVKATTDPPAIGDVVDLGDAKQPRPYDDEVARAIADNQQWWAVAFPALYDTAYTPLAGGVYAGYPERSTPIPGCNGEDRTTAAELATYVAFYCADDDFLAYDDGDDSTFADLTEQYGPAIVAVVISHEWAHAIQKRTGAFGRDLPTVYTEQHADCVAGAWSARARDGESDLIEFSDQDITNALLAIASVRDPAGAGQFESGSHGTAFDRAGAFQTGYTDGISSCAGLLDEPLPLTPVEFEQASDRASTDGDLPFACDGDAGTDCLAATEFFTRDLNNYWLDRNPAFEPIKIDARRQASCTDGVDDSVNVGGGVVVCPATATVGDRATIAQPRFAEIGDFATGYLYGAAWAEAALAIDNSVLTGERRALARDCLAGQWIGDLSAGDHDQAHSVEAELSPDDLDEILDMVLALSDPNSVAAAYTDTRGLGHPVDKIAAIRAGLYDHECASYLAE